jgi:hypothetical protein
MESLETVADLRLRATFMSRDQRAIHRLVAPSRLALHLDLAHPRLPHHLDQSAVAL